jgi:hypothetical protein
VGQKLAKASILLNIAPIDIFLYRRVKTELAGLLLSQDKNSGQTVLGSFEPSSLIPFGGGCTAEKSTSKSAMTRPKKSRYNGVFKMNHINFFYPAFVSDYTSYRVWCMPGYSGL